MRRHHQIIYAAIGVLVGVVGASYYQFDFGVGWLVMILACLLGLTVVKSRLGLVAWLLLGLVIGAWRVSGYLAQQNHPTIDAYQYQKVIIIGTITGEPSWNAQHLYDLYLNRLVVDGKAVPGLLRVSALSGGGEEGNRIELTGKIKPSQGKASSEVGFVATTVIDRHQPWPIRLKKRLETGLRTALPSPQSEFMIGLLIGNRSTLSKDLYAILIATGLAHIVAVSGYNLTILTGALRKRLFRRWQFAQIAGGLWLIASFVAVSGASASIMRAGIMSSVFLILSRYGKRLALAVGLIATAAGMALASPQYLLSDLSWQLSFLSLAGITFLAPPLASLLPRRLKLLREIVSVSLAAQLATLPFVAYKFGVFSVVGLLANVVVMPLIPLLMLGGGIAAMLGLIVPHQAFALSRPLAWICSQLIDFLRYLASWSIAQVDGASPSLAILAVYYGLLALVVLASARAVSKASQSDKIDQTVQDSAELAVV